jgi:MSHA biogenesis protein MshQ
VRSSAANSANHPSTALTIAKPAAVEPGDLLLAVVSHQGGSIRNMTAPAGWTAAPNTDVYESTNARIHAWYRIASGMEPASYTFTLTGGSGMALAGGVAAIEHADALSPIAASVGQSSSAQSITLTAPSLTVPSHNSLLVYGGAVNAPVSFTAPPLMAERWDLSTTGQYNVGTEMAAGALTLAGATGTRTATLSAKAKGAAILIAVNPD